MTGPSAPPVLARRHEPSHLRRHPPGTQVRLLDSAERTAADRLALAVHNEATLVSLAGRLRGMKFRSPPR
jgi:hypothetical protein